MQFRTIAAAGDPTLQTPTAATPAIRLAELEWHRDATVLPPLPREPHQVTIPDSDAMFIDFPLRIPPGLAELLVNHSHPRQDPIPSGPPTLPSPQYGNVVPPADQMSPDDWIDNNCFLVTWQWMTDEEIVAWLRSVEACLCLGCCRSSA